MNDKQVKKFTKTETVEEFLARGGKVTRVEPKAVESKPDVVRAKSGGPANILTYEQGDMYYGDKPEEVPTKPKSTIDITKLPLPLQKKMLEKLNAEKKEDVEEHAEYWKRDFHY